MIGAICGLILATYIIAVMMLALFADAYFGYSKDVVQSILMMVFCGFYFWFAIHFIRIWTAWFKQDSTETRTRLI